MDASIYKSPSSDCAANEGKSAAGKIFAIIGTVFVAGIPVSLLLAAMKLAEVFAGMDAHAGDDAKFLAGAISEALVPLVVGFIGCLPGVVCLFVSIVLFRYRSPWVYWVSLLSGLLGLFLFPIGTLLSVVMLILLVMNRKQFFGKVGKGY